MNTSSVVKLRSLQARDLDWVLAIERENYSLPWSRASFERALHEGVNFALYQPGLSAQPLGYCCLLTVVDELHLLNISLASSFQGQGLGRLAMTALFEHFSATQFNVMLLEVRRSNAAARRLYQTLGFERDGVRKGYYSTPDWGREDAILMSRHLE